MTSSPAPHSPPRVALWRSAADRLLTRDAKVRIRLRQWAISVVIYAAFGVALGVGVSVGWLPFLPWVGWCLFVAAGLAVFHVRIRTGQTGRSVDKGMTELQMAFGVLTVLWGYGMSGPWRSTMLFPLMLIMTFGAFSLSWGRMMRMVAFTLGALGAVMLAMRSRGVPDAQLDIANAIGMAIVLPATAGVASILNGVRQKLRAQREELATALAQIRQLATHDELTGLANRRHALALLEAERQRAARSGQPYSVAVVDLDHFKQINDRHGHAGGDQALRGFARAVGQALRATDVAARWGGEEFLLLMPQTRATDAAAAVERVRQAVGMLRIESAGAVFGVTFSAGVREARAGEPVARVVLDADTALYEAKRAGRDRVVVAPADAAPPDVARSVSQADPADA